MLRAGTSELIDSAIDCAIFEAGSSSSTAADRAYCFKFHSSGTRLSNTHMWSESLAIVGDVVPPASRTVWRQRWWKPWERLFAEEGIHSPEERPGMLGESLLGFGLGLVAAGGEA